MAINKITRESITHDNNPPKADNLTISKTNIIINIRDNNSSNSNNNIGSKASFNNRGLIRMPEEEVKANNSGDNNKTMESKEITLM